MKPIDKEKQKWIDIKIKIGVIILIVIFFAGMIADVYRTNKNFIKGCNEVGMTYEGYNLCSNKTTICIISEGSYRVYGCQISITETIINETYT